MKITESQLRKIIRQELKIVLENAPEIKDLKTASEIEMCDYDLSKEGVKIFFTLPSSGSTKEQFRNRMLIQGRDIIRNLFKGSLSAASVHHAGFVFSDGTTLEPIAFTKNNPVITPEKCIILLIKNTGKRHEDLIRQRGEELVKFHENMGHDTSADRYNYAGIAHKIPFIGNILKNVVPRKLNTYYCSQLVADLLASAGIITVEQLKAAQSLSENQNEIYDNSALSPSELYDLIKDKAELLQQNCL
jgi:hypothetical protein